MLGSKVLNKTMLRGAIHYSGVGMVLQENMAWYELSLIWPRTETYNQHVDSF